MGQFLFLIYNIYRIISSVFLFIKEIPLIDGIDLLSILDLFFQLFSINLTNRNRY